MMAAHGLGGLRGLLGGLSRLCRDGATVVERGSVAVCRAVVERVDPTREVFNVRVKPVACRRLLGCIASSFFRGAVSASGASLRGAGCSSGRADPLVGFGEDSVRVSAVVSEERGACLRCEFKRLGALRDVEECVESSAGGGDELVIERG